ncbi:MAG: hypothetical protein ACI8Y7_000940 [Candidatus Woesearchaeota archaeon]|jgi:uncharacterized protein YqhQ
MNKPVIGGQAVIEGVLFLSPKAKSLAIRKPDGKIHVESSDHLTLTRKLYMHKVPLIRGIIAFVDMMILGTKSLNRSVEIALEEEEEESSWFTNILMGISFVLGTLIALLLFKFVPFWLSDLAWSSVIAPPVLGVTFLEGFIKACIFVGYIYGISRMNDVKRLFMYHGAEHKVIRCFEADKKLTVENVMKSSRFHPRCGTSFVVFTILLSVLLYSFIPLEFGFWTRYGLRLLMLPLLAGLSYEILYLTSKVSEHGPLRFLLWPGYAVQVLTTREPKEEMVEVSIASFEACYDQSKFEQKLKK